MGTIYTSFLSNYLMIGVVFYCMNILIVMLETQSPFKSGLLTMEEYINETLN
jgi:hypothetical protein